MLPLGGAGRPPPHLDKQQPPAAPTPNAPRLLAGAREVTSPTAVGRGRYPEAPGEVGSGASIPPARQGQRDGGGHAPAEPRVGGTREKRPRGGSRRAPGSGPAAPGRQSRRAGALLCKARCGPGSAICGLNPAVSCALSNPLHFNERLECQACAGRDGARGRRGGFAQEALF